MRSTRRVKDGEERRENNIPGSAGRESWRWARSARAQCTRGAEGGRRCSTWCREGGLSSTPTTWCLGGPYRRTWPGVARAPAAFVAYRPTARREVRQQVAGRRSFPRDKWSYHGAWLWFDFWLSSLRGAKNPIEARMWTCQTAAMY